MEAAPRSPGALSANLLLLTTALIAICGLVYELLAGTLASYLLGDSITQFSTVIGVYLSAMGLGSWLSGKVDKQIARRFVEVELAVAVVGGASAPLLFLAFAHLSCFRLVLYGVVATVGTLVGLEIPLLLRVLKDQLEFKDLIARVLTVDYLGALVASLLFPIFLVPRLGIVRTGLMFGLLNAGVALWSTQLLSTILPRRRDLQIKMRFGSHTIIDRPFAFADRLTSLAEEGMYADEVIFAKTTPYQRIIITRGRASFQLFLNGNLQFSSADEHRYHEALVHPAMMLAGSPKRVLVLGGGDGLATRELLKYSSVEEIQLVDLDPAMTELATTSPALGASRTWTASTRRRCTSPTPTPISGSMRITASSTRRSWTSPTPTILPWANYIQPHFYKRFAARAESRRAGGGAEHQSFDGAAELLVCCTNPGGRRACYPRVSCRRALVWRVGICPRPRCSIRDSPARAAAVALSYLNNDAALGAMFVFPADMTRCSKSSRTASTTRSSFNITKRNGSAGIEHLAPRVSHRLSGQRRRPRRLRAKAERGRPLKESCSDRM